MRQTPRRTRTVTWSESDRVGQPADRGGFPHLHSLSANAVTGVVNLTRLARFVSRAEEGHPLAARGESPHGIRPARHPARRVVPRSNMPNILPRRARPLVVVRCACLHWSQTCFLLGPRVCVARLRHREGRFRKEVTVGLRLGVIVVVILITPSSATAQNWSFDARRIALGGVGDARNPALDLVDEQRGYSTIVLPFGLFQVLGGFLDL